MINGFSIGARRLGEAVLVVAEGGVNHNGSLTRALGMVDEAAKAGADAIKFQAFVSEELVTSRAPKAEYQKKSGSGKTQLDMLKPLQLSAKDFKVISDRAGKRGIMMISTPFDEKSVDLLESLGVPAYKVGSGDLTNVPLLEHIGKKGKPVLLSTGMATLDEVDEAVSTVRAQGNNQIILLHCVSSYPAQVEDSNLRAIQVLRERFKLPVGFSDHSEFIETALAATALGAGIIEKHFTLSRRLPGPDHKSSLEPSKFRQMVKGIRLVEKALGQPVKQPTQKELEMRPIARRSPVASVDIGRGQVITREMLAVKRPGTGLHPRELQKLVGKRATRFIGRDEQLTWDMVE